MADGFVFDFLASGGILKYANKDLYTRPRTVECMLEH